MKKFIQFGLVLLVFYCVHSTHAAKIKVACVGDSITYGAGIADRSNNSYPAQLQVLLGADFTVGNFGHSGARVSHVQKKWYKNFEEYSESLAFKPNIVFIALGINDCTITQWNANKPHFVSDYKSLIADYKALPSKPRIILGTLMPVVHPHGQVPEINNGPMADCTLLIEQIAKDQGLELIDLYTRLEMEPGLFARDGIHPDRFGVAIIADQVFKSVTGNHGGIKMPWVFGDYMVLQRDKPIPIFGTANVGSKVTVKLSKIQKIATADANGTWRVDLPSMSAGGPHTLICQTKEDMLTFTDVMVGEVWIASGQSNMAWRLSQDADWNTEGPLADNFSNIRLFSREASAWGSGGKWDQTTQDKVTVDEYYSGNWATSSQESASRISAVAWYFAKNIHTALDVPVGIIDNAVGGTTMEAYMPLLELYKDDRHQLTDDWLNASVANDWHRGRAKQNLGLWLSGQKDTPMPHHCFEPAFLYNADIADLMPFAIRGVIWYQGESNATDASNKSAWSQEWNRKLFEGLITSWRERWGQGNFPFYYVQLPNLNREWMLFREMQLQTLERVPNTGMAVTIDIGNPRNVHPKAKKEVGRRLSLWARAKQYGESNLVYSGPLFNGKFSDEGATLRVSFDHVGGGLEARGGGALTGFEVAGADGNWHAAKTVVQDNGIVLSSAEVEDPQAVRYAWAQNPKANLVNAERLPASPFRAGDMSFDKTTTWFDASLIQVDPIDASQGPWKENRNISDSYFGILDNKLSEVAWKITDRSKKGGSNFNYQRSTGVTVQDVIDNGWYCESRLAHKSGTSNCQSIHISESGTSAGNRRFLVWIKANKAGKLVLGMEGGSEVILDGINGKPDIELNEFFTLRIERFKGAVGSASAALIVNGIEVYSDWKGSKYSGGAFGAITFGSGSSAGTGTTSYAKIDFAVNADKP